MLSEIAAGIEVTDKQCERGVATVDETDADLADGLRAVEAELPCSAGAAAAVVSTYIAGASVGDAADEAGLVPMTAAKTLHLLGVEGLSPLAPEARRIVRDWQSGDLSRADAQALTGATEAEFALASYVEAHDPLPDAAELVRGVLRDDADAAVEKRDRLSATMSGVDDLL
ncbi:hypothetical protein SAMN06269185_2272 [Natronoarchaeum philippinense]|uniref:Uncharacterized protein n=1 Tax=Natronoarchaeum philippinense TaxID=558529 RepID=A0A285P0N4_NATPI|nr:hypothetical protein [Natronoarchaeum philippinense]SNZ14837.1 hypothetical protein SAMN06269185_2272 [Natronoarchaeum philippinense]